MGKIWLEENFICSLKLNYRLNLLRWNLFQNTYREGVKKYLMQYVENEMLLISVYYIRGK